MVKRIFKRAAVAGVALNLVLSAATTIAWAPGVIGVVSQLSPACDLALVDCLHGVRHGFGTVTRLRMRSAKSQRPKQLHSAAKSILGRPILKWCSHVRATGRP
jgi:hypothetical protein